jgi:DNA-nicking Smr family endonuclease
MNDHHSDDDDDDVDDPAQDAAEPIHLPIEDSLDLHAIAPADVGEAVAGYLEACWERGFREVRIIHGRGTGVQREIVRSLLARSPHVTAFADAPGERGGWGATVVTLAEPPLPSERRDA